MVRKIDLTHFCIAVAAQDIWSSTDFEKLRKATTGTFHSNAEQSDCKTCCNCPVCRYLWDLFDPEKPGPYDNICLGCRELIPIMGKSRGSGDGLTLFSHQTFPGKMLRALAATLVASPKVKKVVILQLDADIKIGPGGARIEKLLTFSKVKVSDFLAIVDKDKFKYDTVYEIVKDRYY